MVWLKQRDKGGLTDRCVLVEKLSQQHGLREASVPHDSEHPDGAAPS